MDRRTTRVTTWADGFGRWHAEIEENGVGDALRSHHLAHEALWYEISQRDQDADQEAFEIERISRVSRDGVLTSEFVESDMDDE